ncbi:MAG: transglycosylase SLT domain-containing protein [Elusimicrobiota bacterium]
MPPPPSPTLPGPLTPFDAMIVEEAKAAGMDPGVVKALIAAKGGFREDAGRASGGSYGLMLVSKGAAAGVGMKGADLKDPRNNIRAGSLILAKLFKTFGGDLHRALAAYQVGPGKVIKSGGIPNDPEVRFLLAQYERAYRHGSPKPGVKPVEAPGSPNLRRAKEEAGRKAEEIKESLSRAKYPVARYRKVIERVAAKRGADPDLIEAVMRAENPWADPMLGSRAGAIGLMQIMPETARQLGIDPRNPVQNIDGGVRHLKWLLQLYDGNKVLAVAAYNAGDGNIRGGRIPNFAETKDYVRKVFRYYEEITGVKVDYAPYLPVPRASKKRNKPA